MATTIEPRTRRMAMPSGSVEPVKANPAKWWASVGAIWLVFAAFVIGKWILDGQAVRTPTGPDEAPVWVQVTTHTLTVVSPLLALAMLYFLVWRGWKREGHLTTDGVFVIAWLCMYFQDPFMNYSQTHLFYNSYTWNLGSWASAVPGWTSPNGHLLPEPILFIASFYVYAGMGATLLALRLVRRLKARRPEMSRARTVFLIFAFYCVFDFFLEMPWMLTQQWAYPGAMRWFTMFAGKTYQFPLHEPLVISFFLTTLAALRIFTNDKGEMLVERGLTEIKVKKASTRQWIRLLAVIGATQTIYLVTYNIPMQWFATHADTFPKYPSYMTNGMCGEGTKVPCPSPTTPIPRAS